ncbi:MAG TPA: peptide ABC transporter substrate-binding protein [Clostridiaceae bacterium]|nr:peptide ABC transporter substrate-binding protein [Clostridiaceae bacterium]
MKKLTALLLAAMMSLSVLAACGNEDENPDAAPETPAETPAETPGEEPTGEANPLPEWEAYDALIKEIKSSTDFAAREALMHDAEDMLMETFALVPLYYYNDIYLQKPEVNGIYSNPYGTKYFMYGTAPDNVLKLQLASEPDKLDPALNSTVDGATLAANTFVGLFTYDENGELTPALAEDYTESEDGLTYEFTLKEGLKWSDGSELTAKDFEYAWKRAANPETGADYSYMFNAIAGFDDNDLQVTASEDGRTLTVVLAAPTAYFLDLVAFPTYLPLKQEAVEGAADYATNPGAWALEAGFVSNGAYTLESWSHNENMVYVKNPNYYEADKVTIEKLELMLSDDDAAIFAAYNSGDLHFIDVVPTDEIAALLDNPEFNIVDQLGTYYVTFNVKSPLFEGKTAEQANAMRKAIAILIDRGYIVENIAQTGQQPANTFIPAGMMDGNGGVFKENNDGYTYPVEASAGYFDPEYSDASVEEAISLLEEAGFTMTADGMLDASNPISFEYVTNESSAHVAVAEAMQQDLAVVGIDMKIKTLEWSVFLNERKAGNFDVARNGWIADFNDPINMLEMWTSDSGNNDAQFGK